MQGDPYLYVWVDALGAVCVGVEVVFWVAFWVDALVVEMDALVYAEAGMVSLVLADLVSLVEAEAKVLVAVVVAVVVGVAVVTVLLMY